LTANSIGERFRITSFGESHGRLVGVIVDGCPAGLELSEKEVQAELDRRRPGVTSISTPRREEDRVEILSGLLRGSTTGASICMIVWNREADSSPYERIRSTPRPGHADFTSWVKYGGFNDYRGGGRGSGRITAGFVAAGAVAKKLLARLGVRVLAHTVQIGEVKAGDASVDEIERNVEKNTVRCADLVVAEAMEEEIRKAMREGDSVGGLIRCVASGVPVGFGEPVFDTLEGDIAKALFAIPAVKGVDFWSGFEGARLRGSRNNDPFIILEGRVRTLTNNAGGILGGISNGMPITCRVAVKPTPSISLPQRTVNLKRMSETQIIVHGRHDPCIVPRAVPVVEAMVSAVLVDHALRVGVLPVVLRRAKA
jgi:chorismate synthase